MNTVSPITTPTHAGLASLMQPLNPFLNQPDVIEICINRPQDVFVETYNGWAQHRIESLTYEYLFSLVATIANYSKQSISAATPLLSGSLPNGERIQIVIPPAVPQGTISITIRKPSQKTFTLDEYEEMGLFDDVKTEHGEVSKSDKTLLKLYEQKDWKAFLSQSVIHKKNILISGSTGSGKTTFSKALLPFIPKHERLITIEDTLELDIPHENAVRLVYSKGDQGQAKISAKDLLESSLRMRPDRIFLQELRDASAFYYLRNVNTGHAGAITTIHADSSILAFEQLALLVKESDAGRDLKRSEIKEMLFQMVDVVLQVKKTGSGIYRMTEVYFDPARKLERKPT